MAKTVIFDFDGVIHSYTSGWKGATTIIDRPVIGVAATIRELRMTGYRVVVVSTRCYEEGGIEAIKAWLKAWDIEVDDVTGEKPPAIVTVDDRAICFDGNPWNLVQKIEKFVPWNKELSSAELKEWLESRFPLFKIAEEAKFEFTEDVANKRVVLLFQTEKHTYTISVANNYLGGIMSNRYPDPGEDHIRGADLADGPRSEETLRRIFADIVAFEMTK